MTKNEQKADKIEKFCNDHLYTITVGTYVICFLTITVAVVNKLNKQN